MKKALNIAAVAAFLIVAGLIIYLKTISDGKNIYVSTGFENGVIAKVARENVSMTEVNVLLADAKMEYEEMFGDDIWNEAMGDITFEEYVIKTIRARIMRQKCMNTMAQSWGIVLNSTQEQNVTKAAQEYMSLLTKEQIKSLGVSEDIMKQMYTQAVMAQLLFEDITLEVDTEVSEDSARVITIQYIRTMDKSSADKILSRIKAGEGFLSLALENNPYEYEYTLKRGETEKAFEDAAFSLATGEVSDVISTNMGYYIILCVNDYDKIKTASNKEQIIIERKLEAFNAVFEPYESDMYAEYDEEQWKSLSVSTMEKLDTSFNSVYEKYFK